MKPLEPTGQIDDRLYDGVFFDTVDAISDRICSALADRLDYDIFCRSAIPLAMARSASVQSSEMVP